MNLIKKTAILILVISAIVACSNDEEPLSVFDFPSFVRFNFLVNNNNEPLEYPAINSALTPLDTFVNSAVKPLKIPVTLSSKTLTNPVTVSYSITSNGATDFFSLNPLNQVSFQENQLTDTIVVLFNKRWEIGQSLEFKLENASDTSIHIGNLNTAVPNNTLAIHLNEIETTYTFETNLIEIKGEEGEQIQFKVLFPNGFIPSEIDDEQYLKFLNGFNYTLDKTEYGDNRTSINYSITLTEDIQNDDAYYQTTISLLETEHYTTIGNTILQIVKPIKSDRELSTNPAANFYNLDDSFHRTYGEHWNDFNNDGICAWQSFFAFSYPVVVDADDPNGILYDDKGTPDPSDDIYHHAFKIGFRSSKSSTTTNSFNLKRYFTNESTSFANSPGFDVFPAIEFFPENGNSTTNGSALIIPQFITIANRNGNSYNIAISGEGTYQEISTGLFEISLELKLTNDVLFGGTITSEYRLYNNTSYTEPEPLTTNNCVTETDL